MVSPDFTPGFYEGFYGFMSMIRLCSWFYMAS